MKYLLLFAAVLLAAGLVYAKPELPELEKPYQSYLPSSRANEVEPNDDCTQANPLTVDDPMNGDIDPGGDEDWYVISVVAGGCYTFETHPGDIGDTKLYIVGADCDLGNYIAYDDDGGVGYYSLITHTFATSGTFYVVVTGYSSSYTGSYILTMTACPEPPPNCTCDTAIDLQEQGLSTFTTSTCGCANDYSPTNYCTGYSQANGIDIVYKIYLTVGQTFAVALTDEDYDASIYLLTDCSDMESCVAGGDDPEEFSYVATSEGWHYLVVDGYCCDYCGTATLTILDPIATDQDSWGAVKALYR